MKLAYIRWQDAVTEYADDHPSNEQPSAQLALLEEIGFIIHETDEAVLIGMELTDDVNIMPGRFRLHIPKSGILELRTIELDAAFKIKKPKKKKSVTKHVTQSTAGKLLPVLGSEQSDKEGSVIDTTSSPPKAV